MSPMTKPQIMTELKGLMASRDYLITRVTRSRARESEKAMTIAKYEREKMALRHAIEMINAT